MLLRCAEVVIVSLVAAVNAIKYPGPKATPATAGFPFDGWTPKPTSKPQLELLRRQDIPEFCGFVDGDANNPALCDYSSTCLYDSVNSWFGCCTGTVLEDCDFKTACVQSASSEEDDSFVTYCTEELYPYCLLYQSIFDGSTFSHFGCADTQTTLEILPTTTDDATFVFETTDDFLFSDESTSTGVRSSRATSSSDDEESTTEIGSSSTSSNDDRETASSSVPRSTGVSTTGARSQTPTPIEAATTSSTAGAAMQTAVVGAVGGVLGLLLLL
ncbi:hypothetical protein BDV96DRAFT_687478 [Lophiotrema nucula]|uniref:Extracellular membrane protein CFEM domain-containing protein n=1 Tax=Lophiotrema nucula TaxID=690887 RepID=A0A6A5Z8Z9_9PLEO|nr:hypothetical protein BDV96DRAFT_687478 [Lophiotrema nucula]